MLTSLQIKAQKNEEKEMITALLRDKSNVLAMQAASEMTPALKSLEEKLDRSVSKERTDSHIQGSLMSKSLKDSGLCRFAGSKNKVQRISNSKKTL